MQTSNYWRQFESTGRVEDYLVYKSVERESKYQSKSETEQDLLQKSEEDSNKCRNSFM